MQFNFTFKNLHVSKEQKMKKVLFVLLSLLVIAALGACVAAPTAPAATDSAAAPAAEAPAASNITVGVAMPTQSLQRWNQDGTNMKAQLEAEGYTVDLQYANNDINTQLQQLENMLTKGVNALVVASIDGSALTDVLAKAGEQGVPVIAYDRLLMNSENVDYYATFDNWKVGTMQGNYIVEQLDLENAAGPFNIELFTGSPDDNNARFFFGGAMEVLQPYIDSGKLVVPSGQTEFTAVATQAWDSAVAQARMDNLITANYAGGAVLDAILSSNDSVAIGIVAALQNAGYGAADKPYPILTGQDCDKANVKAMIAGQQSMCVFKDTRSLAAQVVGMVNSIVTGGEVEVNDTTTYDNNVKVVPSFLVDPVFADASNYTEILLDSGYYTEADLQ